VEIEAKQPLMAHRLLYLAERSPLRRWHVTAEERLNKIENVLQGTVELQAKQRHDIEQQNEGIRSLIAVARTCLDSFQEVRGSFQEVRESIKDLRDAQTATEEKLNILISTVDRIIRQRNGKE
jgi:uncharacterized coiled-coil DUF342 family protein